jgi:two-component system sensor histidine kinase RegB
VSESLAQHRENLALRLETLIRIRWLAVIGQTIAVFFVHFFLGFELLLLPCLLLIAMSAWLNVFLRLRYPGNVRWRGRAVTALLGYDVLQLAVLLYLTGGVQNPFAILIAVPVVISAASQRVRNFIPLLAFALGTSLLLVFFHQPLPWFEAEVLSLPIELKGGIWVAIASTTCFTAIYIFRVADESRKLADALAATELVLQREQLMSNLDGLAAAAAHELGTPLATISLVAKEMMNDTQEGSDLYEDAELLKSQADRCREILQKISSLSSEEDDNIATLALAVLMEEVAAPYRDIGKAVEINLLGEGDPPSMRRNAAVLYGISNLLENAIDFATRTIRFDAQWDDETVRLSISDDGPGFGEGVIEKIGDPFISRRSGAGLDTSGGLGLGLFIAKTLLERNGAELTFSNYREGNASGARVEVCWPLADFEKGSKSVMTTL